MTISDGTLIKCSNLHALQLGKNRIGNDGLMSITDALVQCSQLHTLCIDDNNIGISGA